MRLGWQLAPAFAEPIRNAPPDQQPEPTLEGTHLRFVFELRNGFGDGDKRLLHDILGLRFAQPRLDGHPVNQLPVRVEEIVPTLLIAQIFDSSQQALPGRDELVRVHAHNYGPLPRLSQPAGRFFQKSMLATPSPNPSWMRRVTFLKESAFSQRLSGK